MTNGFTHPYHLGKSTFILGTSGAFFIFFLLSQVSMKFISVANIIDPDLTPRSAASHLGLYCLPMLHKRTSGL